MSGFRVNTSDFKMKSLAIETKVKAGAYAGVQKATLDLHRISSQIAPILSGDLRRTSTTRIRQTPMSVTGEVIFSVTTESPGYGPFNYAYWTHEYTYKLGPKSQKAGGTDGYAVGNKYLERPLYGEAPKYVAWWAASIKASIES